MTLSAVLAALTRKDKGFLYLETHAGRGRYDLRETAASDAALTSVERILDAHPAPAPEIERYARIVSELRTHTGLASAYPGSPLIAAAILRKQDRAVFIELAREECRALAAALPDGVRGRVECADGFDALRAFLPPPERRGLILIDPPYEESRDFARAQAALAEILRRFATAVIALWYPIKERRDVQPWLAELDAASDRPRLVGELWIHPCDSRVALNGSGLVLVNPPFGLAERMQAWLPALHRLLDPAGRGGSRISAL